MKSAGVPHVGRVVRAGITREQRPIAADARVHRDVLLTVGTAV